MIPSSFTQYEWSSNCSYVDKKTIVMYTVKAISRCSHFPNTDEYILGAIENVCCGNKVICKASPMSVIEEVRVVIGRLHLLGQW